MTKKVCITRNVIDSLLTYSKDAHPEEGILILRGKVERHTILVDSVMIPPFSVHAEGFSSYPFYTLPADLSILGVAHSHPSGGPDPSEQDLLSFYGRLMIIMTYPYRSEDDVVMYDREGNQVTYMVV